MGRGLVRTVLAGGSFVLDCRLVDDCGGACCSVCVVCIVYIYLFCVFGSRWYPRALCPSLPRLTVGKRPVVVVAVQGAPRNTTRCLAPLVVSLDQPYSTF